ncbi:uncharacterized protein LOC127131850 [Lathyrus oleraceus]|uniref:uncharacterized protein LOC127131850 n=1 Tax=Pisum sativum TaxID=3888 RepID=UPI0021D0EDAB|nr:uncharacterized protein LOC127131850 [Pisum sativum]
MQSGILSFKDSSPNVQANSLPKHGNATMNMVEGCPGKYRVFDVNLNRRSLVEMYATLCESGYYEHDHAACHVCPRDYRGCAVVKRDLQEIRDQNLIQVTRDRNEGEHEVNIIVPRFNLPEPVVIAYDGQKTDVSPLVIRLAVPTHYESDKVVPYNCVTLNGRVFAAAAPKRTEDVMIEKLTQEKTPITQTGQSSSVNQNADQDEVLKLIKRSNFNEVDQLLHTPSKIFVISLLMSSEKVLEQVYVDHDVRIDQFDGIMANITSCNTLSFSDEELREQGRNHNLPLHISLTCQEYAMSNVLVGIGSSLNVMPKSTLSKLSYQGTPMRFSGVIVKAFDGSRKTVIGEVGLPIKIEFEANLFHALSVDNIVAKKNEESTSSLKDTKHVLKNAQSIKLGQVVELAENRNRDGLGFSPGITQRNLKQIQEMFHSVGFIHSKDRSTTASLEDPEEQGVPNFMTCGSMCQNWIDVDVPSVIHLSK